MMAIRAKKFLRRKLCLLFVNGQLLDTFIHYLL